MPPKDGDIDLDALSVGSGPDPAKEVIDFNNNANGHYDKKTTPASKEVVPKLAKRKFILIY